MDKKIEELFYKVVYEWVANNFGESEAEDPSWSIEELAKELTKNFWKIKDEWEIECLAEDVADVAEENDIELTEKEKYAVANEYRYSEAYCELDRDSVEYFIRRELELEKEKGATNEKRV